MSKSLSPSEAQDLSDLAESLLRLCSEANDRFTVQQASFFLVAALADARGRPMTVSEVLGSKEGIFNPSLQNTYKVLLEPNRKDYQQIGLGWLDRETNPDDERQKFLRLTDRGRAIARLMLNSTRNR